MTVEKFRFTAHVLRSVLQEIKPQIQNSRVKSVYADRDRMEIAITFSNGKTLYAKVRHPHIRMHLSGGTYPGVPDWTGSLKKYRLKEINQVDNDRIVRLLFEKKNPLGEKENLELYLELTGKYGNAVLVKDGKVLKVLRENLSVRRPLRPGLPFIPYETRPYLEDKPLKISPHICFVEGRPVLSLEGPVEGVECIRMEGISQAIETYYSMILSGQEEKEEKEKDPGGEIEKLKKRIREMEEEMQRALRIGSHIMENLHTLREGDVVEIDEKKVKLEDRPARVAGKFFEEYKRLKRGIQKLQQRIEEIERQSGIARENTKREDEERKGPSRPYRIFESPGGFRVYVGKSAKGNDYLLSKVASPEDHWFHVKDSPGSHVIMKTGGAHPSEEDILFAARLALQFSKASTSGKGLVSHTLVKYLKKPAGAPPGLVIVRKEEVIPVRLER